MPWSDEQLRAAVAALEDAGRLREAQQLIARIAPQLEQVLDAALHEGGWFGDAHEQALGRAATPAELPERVDQIRALVAEETRLAMLVGVTVGYELARALPAPDPKSDRERT